jgi:FKBP-type peptidyl-prolyl cis-trans isomerase FkpA
MKKTLWLGMASALVLTACKSDSLFEGYTKAESGLHYKMFNRTEDAPTATIGSGIGIRYSIKKQSNDSLLVSSKDIVQDGSGVLRQVLVKPSCKGGIEDAIMMLGKGDSAAFIISADSFFLKTMKRNELPTFIKKGDYLTVNIKMVDLLSPKELEENQKKQQEEQMAIEKKMGEEEQANIAKYVADNKINVQPDANGLYLIQEKAGTGDLAVDGDSLYVEYTGMLLNGKVFDTSRFEDAKELGKPQEYCKPIPILLGDHRVIEAWEMTLRQMKKGSKVKVIIPSKLGYGPNAMGDRIPAFSTLVFNMELKTIKKNK